MKKTALILGLFALIMIEGTILTGPLANEKRSSENASNVSLVGIKSVGPVVDVAASYGSNGKLITWSTENFPSSQKIDINIIRKTSDSPVSYEFVRKVANDIDNTGSFVWTPKDNELSSGLYLEVTCSGQSSNCRISSSPISLE